MNPDDLYTIEYVTMYPIPNMQALTVDEFNQLRDLGYFG